MPEYLNYNNVDERFNFPSNYYVQDFSNPFNNVSIRMIVLDDQPWLSGNVAQPGKTPTAGSLQAKASFQAAVSH